MKKVEKMALPVVVENDEPKAVIFYNKNRDRIIYILEKAGEDELIELLENKEHEKIEH
jgi:hypothetical protein